MDIILLILTITFLLIDLIIFYKNNKKYNSKISSQNKILFYKLKKQYLNNTSIEDIKQLITFLNKEVKEREKKNENKK